MIFPIDLNKLKKISADFHEMRPLGSPTPTHVHGAWDLACASGTPIMAPEDGFVVSYMGVRNQEGQSWNWSEGPTVNGELFEWMNYFYDMYGGIYVLFANSGRVHVFAHSYMNQIFNKNPLHQMFEYKEQKDDARFPVFGFISKQSIIKQGDVFGYSGNAGFSTGSHIHWEIHPNNHWNEHNRRLDPKLFFEEIYENYFKGNY